MGRIDKLRKNKKYGYSPRYFEDNGEGAPFKIEHRFDKFRSTVDAPKGLKAKFRSAMEDSRVAGDRNMKLRFLLILAVLVLIVLFILDFDLSIFFPK